VVGPLCSGPSPRPVHGSTDSSLNEGCRFPDQWPRLIQQKGNLASNPGHWLRIRRLGIISILQVALAYRALGRRHDRWQRELLAQHIVLQMLQGLLLRHLCDKRFLFCSPTAAEMVYTGPVAGTHFGRWWAMVKATSGEAPALRSSPTSSSCPPLASRPVQWLQSAMKSLNLVAARVQRVLSLAGEIPCYGVRYL
jgi:hypothetical protein